MDLPSLTKYQKTGSTDDLSRRLAFLMKSRQNFFLDRKVGIKKNRENNVKKEGCKQCQLIITNVRMKNVTMKFQAVHKMSEPSPPCPKCNTKDPNKVFKKMNFVLKGQGWFNSGGY